jgi:hypothetical protein
MTHKTRLLMLAAWLSAGSGLLLAAEPSPFADKPCLSYSSFKDKEPENGGRWGSLRRP